MRLWANQANGPISFLEIGHTPNSKMTTVQPIFVILTPDYERTLQVNPIRVTLTLFQTLTMILQQI